MSNGKIKVHYKFTTYSLGIGLDGQDVKYASRNHKCMRFHKF